MKKMKLLTLLAILGTPFAYAAEKDHDHSTETKKEHADHDDHDEEDGHGKEEKGPNGGRLIKSVTPAAEVTTGKDRKLRIAFLDENQKPVAPAAQVVTASTGERANPVKLVFTKGEGEDAAVLVADKPLPDGAHVPVVLQIKVTPDAKTVTERFEVHLH